MAWYPSRLVLLSLENSKSYALQAILIVVFFIISYTPCLSQIILCYVHYLKKFFYADKLCNIKSSKSLLTLLQNELALTTVSYYVSSWKFSPPRGTCTLLVIKKFYQYIYKKSRKITFTIFWGAVTYSRTFYSLRSIFLHILIV